MYQQIASQHTRLGNIEPARLETAPARTDVRINVTNAIDKQQRNRHKSSSNNNNEEKKGKKGNDNKRKSKLIGMRLALTGNATGQKHTVTLDFLLVVQCWA
jgi:hypothetical protein